MNRLMWTATTRAQHKRGGLRFASDLTDAEWAVIEPLLPAPSPIGRPPARPMRDIVNAIFYGLRGIWQVWLRGATMYGAVMHRYPYPAEV